jgi:hypothetical protein
VNKHLFDEGYYILNRYSFIETLPGFNLVHHTTWRLLMGLNTATYEGMKTYDTNDE